MSRCYYVECKDGFIDLEALKNNIQKLMEGNYTVHLDKFEPSDGEGGTLYLEGESARGVQLSKIADDIVVKFNVLCNYMDFFLGKIILKILNVGLEEDVLDEDDLEVNLDDAFTDDKIQEIREQDALMTYKAIEVAMTKKPGHVQIPGVTRYVYFGEEAMDILSDMKDQPDMMADFFEDIMNHVQYELPDYNMPGAALIKPKGCEDEKDMIKIRMMFEDTDYILQDYEYLVIRGEGEEIFFIDQKDLWEICDTICKDDSAYEMADDYTIVFPKLSADKWAQFVALAREKNHKEMLNATPAAKPINLTPDYDPENDGQDEDNTGYQNHRDHLECILGDSEDELMKLIKTALKKAELVGKVETDYVVEGPGHGKAVELTYAKKEDDPIISRILLAEQEEAAVFASMYPFVKDGNVIEMKVTEIEEWENGLEAWITGEINESREITFFDADYTIHKHEYEIGKTYKFMIGALAYVASEPESKGFTFEGQQAIDFKAKMGEEPEYDENGKVVPINFSIENLCSFMQVGHAPDEVEFISTVEEVETVKSFGKSFWKFDTKYRNEDGEDILIPTFIQKTPDNKPLNKATQIQGLLWVTGYMVADK